MNIDTIISEIENFAPHPYYETEITLTVSITSRFI